MAVSKGDAAPPVKLPARPGEQVEAHIGRDKVVLLFFPLAFSPVCTDEMCHLRDTWSEWEGLGAQVLGISVDSPFVTDRFRRDEKIPFPILSDFNREVCSQYGVLHADLKGLKGKHLTVVEWDIGTDKSIPFKRRRQATPRVSGSRYVSEGAL